MANLFPPNSRFSTVSTTTLVLKDGTTIVYLRRHFVPPPSQFALLGLYTVKQGDRLDNLAAQFFGDPLLFWRLCDANGAMRPEELTETVGESLLITLPQGIPGSQNA
jgi:hypothetical protein